MNLTTKYNIKMVWDQFGSRVSEDYCDLSEIDLLTSFEDCINTLRGGRKDSYTMIELGSNQAYYSCVFKAALGSTNTNCFMIEPILQNMNRGKENFEANKFDGVFINKLVGRGVSHSSNAHFSEIIRLSELVDQYKIEDVDVLHCDIDGAEFDMLMENLDMFKKKKIDWIFLLTHDEHATRENHRNDYNGITYNILHDACKALLLDCGYKVVTETDKGVVCHDTLIVFRR